MFKDKDVDNLQFNDFPAEYFPSGWSQWYHHCGNLGYHGRTVVFPIKIEPYLKQTRPNGFVTDIDGTVRQKQKTFIEMIRIYICKVNVHVQL